MGKYLTALVAVVVVASMVTAGTVIVMNKNDNDKNKEITAEAVGLGKYREVLLDTTKSDLDKAGFKVGDLINVKFNGKVSQATYTSNYDGASSFSLYLNYFAENNQVSLGIYNGEIWGTMGVKVGDKFAFSYGGQDPYYELLASYGAGYSDNREDYSSDAVFANFREVKTTGMGSGVLYRSSSPYEAIKARVSYSADLIEANGVANLLIANMTDEDVGKYCEGKTTYVANLYNTGHVYADEMMPSILYYPDDMKAAMKAVLDMDGSVCVTCSMGKDRTGFLCAILESLAGATYEEVCVDFMLSFENLYHVTKGSDTYNAVCEILLGRILYLFENPDDLARVNEINWSSIDIKVDPGHACRKYLKSVGLTDGELDALTAKMQGH